MKWSLPASMVSIAKKANDPTSFNMIGWTYALNATKNVAVECGTGYTHCGVCIKNNCLKFTLLVGNNFMVYFFIRLLTIGHKMAVAVELLVENVELLRS